MITVDIEYGCGLCQHCHKEKKMGGGARVTHSQMEFHSTY